MEVLVTGATGVLGRVLVPRLTAAGHSVRALVRRAKDLPSGVRAVRGDLVTGEGLAPAVAGTDAIVHCASSPFRHTRSTDVEGTRRLVEAHGPFDPPHFVYISIVGVGRHPLPYYRAKREAENVIEESDTPHTIVRATQFHELLDHFLHRLSRLVMPVGRGFLFQPVASHEVAEELVAIVTSGPQGRAPDFGGPQVLRMEDMARAWMSACGRRRPLVAVPVPGRIARAFRRGVNTCPDRAVGRVTWEEYLSR